MGTGLAADDKLPGESETISHPPRLPSPRLASPVTDNQLTSFAQASLCQGPPAGTPRQPPSAAALTSAGCAPSQRRRATGLPGISKYAYANLQMFGSTRN